MQTHLTQFEFADSIDMKEVDETFQLSCLATASLYGFSRLSLEANSYVSRVRRLVVINSTGEVGKTLLLIFNGFVRREFPHDQVQVIDDLLGTDAAKGRS